MVKDPAFYKGFNSFTLQILPKSGNEINKNH